MKSVFHPMSLWPIVFMNDENRVTVERAVSAIIETRKRVTHYMEKRKKQNFYKQYKAAKDHSNEMFQELGEEAVALSQKEIFCKIAVWADENNVSRQECVCAAIVAMKFALRRMKTKDFCLLAGKYAEEWDESQRKKITDIIKCHLPKTKSWLLDEYGRESPIPNIADMLCSNCNDDQYFSMIDPCDDAEILSGVVESGPLEKQLSPESIEQSRIYVKELKKELRKASAIEKALREKLEMTVMHLTEPLDKAWQLQSKTGDLFVFVLCNLEKLFYSNMIFADHYEKNEALETRSAIATLTGASPQFWQIVLVQLLTDTGGIVEDKFASWVSPFFASLTKHPLKIKRQKLPPEAIKAQAVFAKLVAPYLKGYHPKNLDCFNLDKLSLLEPNKYLQLISLYFACKISKAELLPDNSDDKHVIYHLFDKIIVPNLESIINWMYEGLTDASGDKRSNVALDVWLEPLCQNAPDEIKEHQEAAVVGIEPEEPETWYYVHNPENGASVSDPVTFCNVEGLNGYFKKHGIATIIKPESILNALVYYKRMASKIRSVMPQELCGHEGWHKIKRGKLRILARLDKKDGLFFHIYPRKEWAYRAAV